MKVTRRRSISSSSECHVQWKQVLLCRVVLSCVRCAIRVVNKIVRSTLRQGRVEPIRELGDPRRARLVEFTSAKFGQIMREATTSDDEHSFFSQRRECAPNPKVVFGSKPRLN